MQRHSNPTPLFSFIIPTSLETSVVDAVYSILRSSTFREDVEIVVVVNNAPHIFFAELENEFRRYKEVVSFVLEGASTIGKARNAGIERAKGRYLIHIDADCIIGKHYIENLRQRVAEDFSVANGKVCFKNERNCILGESNRALRELAYFSRKSVAYTPNLIIRSDVQSKFLFDGSIFHGEDTELSVRLSRSGLDHFYFEDLVITHIDNDNSIQIFNKYLYYGVTRTYRFKKWRKSESTLEFYFRLFDEIPDIREKRFFTKLGIMALYILRDIGVLYGLFKWRRLESPSVVSQ